MDKITGGDCYDLWRVGISYFPALAETYSSSNSKIAETARTQDDYEGNTHKEEYKFRKKVMTQECLHPETDAEYEMENETSPVYAAYKAIRSRVQQIFAETADNLHETGQAVQLAAWEYAESDKANGDAINDLKEKIGNGNYATPGGDFSEEELKSKPESMDDIPDGDYDDPKYPK